MAAKGITFVANCVVVEQDLEIVDESYTIESIVEGLKKGDLVTMMGHGGTTPPCIMKISTEFKVVAKIVEQSIFDGEYEEYEVNKYSEE